MSVVTEKNRMAELTTDGVETEFDFDLGIDNDSELDIFYKATGGDYSQLVLNTDYGVVFTENGGTVSTDGYIAPLAAGTLLIIRHLPITQQTNWLYNDNHTEQQHQTDFDRACKRDLQIQEQLDRAVGFAITSSTKNIEFPEPSSDKMIGWNTAATELENKTPESAFVIGIEDGDLLQVDGSPNSGEYARFTSNGLEGRTPQEVSDELEPTIDHDNLLNFAANEHFTEASIDHGAIGGLSDDDHTQYLIDTDFTQDSGVLIGTGVGTYQEETGNTARTSLGLGTGDSPTWAGATFTNAAVIGSDSVVFQPNADATDFLEVYDKDGNVIFKVDTVNNRVGVGTTPAKTLHILDGSDTFGTEFTVEDTSAIKRPAFFLKNDQGNRAGFYYYGSNVGVYEGDMRIDLDSGNLFFTGMGHTNFATTLKIVGTGIPTGIGLELRYISGAGSILAYNRTTSAYLPLNFNGSYLVFKENGAEKMRLTGSNFGIGETAPETLTEWTGTAPYLTLHNSTHEDSDGGRESRLNFKGEQSGGEETTLARIEISHDGVADDQKGKVVVGTNDGDDNDTPTDRIIIGSDGILRFATAGGLAFGSCYGNHIGWSQVNAVQNTWYSISDADMNDGQLNGVAHDGSGKLTVTYAGMYLVNYGCCFEDNVANDHIEVGIEISGSGSANGAGQGHLENKFANEEEHLSSSTILDLAANATLEVAIRTTDAGTPTISVQALNLTATLIGGT